MKLIKKILLLLSLSVFVGCANIVAPTGGPIDSTPPVCVNSSPPNYSTNFNQQKVRIYFDEYVKLNNPNSQIVISPPIEEKAEYRLKGKSLIIEFNEEFKDSTTYNIFFGNSIVNLKENNPTDNFQYVFSTGNFVDSLSIEGIIKNSFDLKVEEDVIVMLYKEIGDSVPYKEKPYYITKTDKSGNFQLNNLAYGNYKLFVIKDANSNYLYDLPNEKIAFVDSLIIPYNIKLPELDSGIVDTMIAKQLFDKKLNLFLFEEQDSIQQIVKAKSNKFARLMFVFKYPVKDLLIRSLKKLPSEDWKIDEFSKNNDTLNCWLKALSQDSLFLEISDNGIVIDTVELALLSKEKARKRKKQKLSEKLLMYPNVDNNDKLDFYAKLNISFSFPVKDFDFSGIVLKEKIDTVFEPISPQIKFRNKSIKRSLLITNKFKEAASYSLFIPPMAFTDIHGMTNDTLILDFKTTELSNYGIIFIDLKLAEISKNHIIQLLDAKDNVLKEIIANSTQKLEFKFLKPGKYKIKAIQDTNENGKWDTGDYMKKLQAERVFYLPEIINVRANWEQEFKWDLK